MNALLLLMLNNAMIVIPFAFAICLIGKRVRRPTLIHCLWVLLLVKLITPPIVQFPIGNLLPRSSMAESNQAGSSVAVGSDRMIENSSPFAFGRSRQISNVIALANSEANVGERAVSGFLAD